MARLINQLREAKAFHEDWMTKVSALLEGIAVNDSQLISNYNNSNFSKWFYGKGQKLAIFQEFKVLKATHAEFLSLYIEIYKLMFRPKKTSLLKKFLGKHEEVSSQDKQQALFKFNTLKMISQRIMKQLDELEVRIMNMSTEEFALLY